MVLTGWCLNWRQPAAPAGGYEWDESMAEPIIQVQDVTKSFGGGIMALENVSLDVTPGEVVVLIGPSGSGKSTLLRCINRLEEPTSGGVLFKGTDLLDRKTNINKVRQNIGMVFQNFNLYPHMTAESNVSLALRKVLKQSKSEASERARQALTDVGLGERARAYPGQLSGGQQQRVGIARALALDPDVILFDEPTSSLDPELVGGVLNVMRDLRKRGMTMVIVTHEMQFAREAADRVIFMNDARVVEEAPPQQIFESPREARTREFLQRISTH